MAGGGGEWRGVAKHVRRAQHAAPLRNRTRMAHMCQVCAPGVRRDGLRPYETGVVG